MTRVRNSSHNQELWEMSVWGEKQERRLKEGREPLEVSCTDQHNPEHLKNPEERDRITMESVLGKAKHNIWGGREGGKRRCRRRCPRSRSLSPRAIILSPKCQCNTTTGAKEADKEGGVKGREWNHSVHDSLENFTF